MGNDMWSIYVFLNENTEVFCMAWSAIAMYMQYVKTIELWWPSEKKQWDSGNCQKHCFFYINWEVGFCVF